MADLSYRKAPGPRGRLLSGCLRQFRRDPIALLLDAAQQHGDVVRLRIGPVLAHLLNHSDHAAHVFEHNHANYDKNTRSVAKIRASCGNSLLTTDGAAWLRQRRIIQPAFQPRALEAFVPAITPVIAANLARWHELSRAGEPLDMVSETMSLTLAVAARVLFGADVTGDAAAIRRSLDTILDDTWRRLRNPIDLAAVSPAFHRPAFRRAVQQIENVVYRIISGRRSNGDDHQDLLAALLRARDGEAASSSRVPASALNDRELRDAVMTLLLAGHETTANALAWTIWLVARSPQVQERLRGEVGSVLNGRTPQADDLAALHYTRMVFAESLRLYPSIWLIERRAVGDDAIAGYRIPAGSTVLVSPYVLHRHPGFWHEPLQFDPDRFAPERSAGRHRLAYIPFGAGPHQCVGRHMALLVAELVLAMLFQKFEVNLVPDQQIVPKPGITLGHKTKLWVNLER